MALWTPYAEKALDLTKAAIKKELPQMHSPPYQRQHERIPYYVYEAPCIPPAQASPDSIDSWSPRAYRKSVSSPEPSYDCESLSDDVEYQAFERDALRAMAEKNGGTLLGNNPRMRRAVQTSQAADDSYRKQRERNNYAAKQSRDRRKLREVRLAFQVTFLKKKLTDLRARLDERVCARCQQQCRC